MFSLKLSYKNKIRRVGAESTSFNHAKLVNVALKLFPELSEANSVHFEWNDEENDMVSLSSDEELYEAFRVMSVSANKFTAKFIVVAQFASQPNTVPKSTGTASHENITCDECGMCPVIGARYKCAVRKDYDLCEVCEANCDQPYAMIKIAKPSQTPVSIFIAFNDDGTPRRNPADSRDGMYQEFFHPPHPEHPPHPPHHFYYPPTPPYHHHHHMRPPFHHVDGRYGGRGGRHGHGGNFRREEWRRFVEEAIASASALASTAVNIAQETVATATSTLKDTLSSTQSSAQSTASASAQTETSETAKSDLLESDAERELVDAAIRESMEGMYSSGFGVEETKSSVEEDPPSIERVSTPPPPPAPASPSPLQAVTGFHQLDAYDWDLLNDSGLPTQTQPVVPRPVPVLGTVVEQPLSVSGVPFKSVPDKVDDLDVWRTELQLLADMGFHDVPRMLPLLRLYASPPVSQLGAVEGAKDANGIMRVINALL